MLLTFQSQCNITFMQWYFPFIYSVKVLHIQIYHISLWSGRYHDISLATGLYAKYTLQLHTFNYTQQYTCSYQQSPSATSRYPHAVTCTWLALTLQFISVKLYLHSSQQMHVAWPRELLVANRGMRIFPIMLPLYLMSFHVCIMPKIMLAYNQRKPNLENHPMPDVCYIYIYIYIYMLYHSRSMQLGYLCMDHIKSTKL